MKGGRGGTNENFLYSFCNRVLGRPGVVITEIKTRVFTDVKAVIGTWGEGVRGEGGY